MCRRHQWNLWNHHNWCIFMEHYNDMQFTSRVAGRNSKMHSFDFSRSSFLIWTNWFLFVFSNSQNVLNSVDIISTSVLGFWSVMTAFCMCELGEQVAEQFIKFNDELAQCSWYTFPIELQRTLATVILNAQKPVIVQGYGRALCTRNAFNKVELQVFGSQYYMYV